MEKALSQADSLVNSYVLTSISTYVGPPRCGRVDCGVMVDNFAAATKYLFPCEPGFPINSRHCTRIPAKLEQNRTLEKLFYNKLCCFCLAKYGAVVNAPSSYKFQ